jgi:hypothetical protein
MTCSVLQLFAREARFFETLVALFGVASIEEATTSHVIQVLLYAPRATGVATVAVPMPRWRVAVPRWQVPSHVDCQLKKAMHS